MLGFPNPLFGKQAAGGGSGGGSDFDPATLFASGEKGVWFDVADLSSIFQDEAGSIPAAVDSPVGRVNDKSGNGHHAVQATAAKRPVLRHAGGIYWLEFDGAGDALATANLSLAAHVSATTLVGFRPSGTALGMIQELSADINAHKGFFQVVNYPAVGKLAVAVNSNGIDQMETSAAGYGSGVTSLLTVSMDFSLQAAASQIVPRINGATGLFTASVDQADNSTMFDDKPLFIGGRGGSSLYFAGRIHGLIARFPAMSASEIIGAESWLRQKAGL